MFKIKEVRDIRSLLDLFKIYPWSLPTIVALGVGSSLSEGFGISLFIPLLDSLNSNKDLSLFNNPFIENIEGFFINFDPEYRNWIVGLSIIIAIFLKAVFSYIYTFLCYWLQHNIVYKLRQKIFNQLMEVSQSFWDENQSGKLVNTLSEGAKHCGAAIHFCVWLVVSLCTITIFTIFLLLISWKLTLLVIVTLGFLSVIIRPLISEVERLSRKNVQYQKTLTHEMIEAFLGIKTIVLFSRQNYEKNRFNNASKKTRNLEINSRAKMALIQPIFQGLAVSILMGIMLVVLESEINLAVPIAFGLMLARLQPQAQLINHYRTHLKSQIGFVEDVLSLIDLVNKPYLASGSKVLSKFKQHIRFEKVSFYYDSSSTLALNNVSFTIPQGKTTALVGPSGAGKSTLINLIFRFYDSSQGKIYVDEFALPDLDLISWRSKIALVSQDVHIFNTSVRDNILYGCPDASEESMIKAAKRANIHDFICELPQGYDTELGERGVRLSGGQKQRISIARAILCNPEILILDEATNALDSISEKLIQDAIHTLSQSKTVITIAHRLSTVKKADQILVLKEGKIVETGNFSSLIEQEGLFSQLYKIQSENSPILNK